MRWIRESLLTLGAVLGALCLLLGLVAVTAGVHVLVFRSGSMAPTIETGDLALTKTVSAAELRSDDVVSVVNATGSRVTHRVVEVTGRGAQRELTLRGDANEQLDREIYQVTEAQRVILVLPNAGYVVAWSTGPVGLLLLGGYGAFLLSVLLRGKPGGGDSPPESRAPGRRRAAGVTRKRAPVLLAMVLGGAMAILPAKAWAAPWTDLVAVAGLAFTADTVVKPAIVSCTITGGLGQKTATIVWTEVSSPYALDYAAALASPVTTMTVTDNGATRQTAFSSALLGNLLNQTYNIRITARLPAPNGNWTSVVVNQPVTVGLLGLSMSCGTAT